MYKFYNPHPQQKIVGDCVKRAFTKASGLTYQEVSNELNRIKRAKNASSIGVNPVWQAYVVENLNGIKMSFPAEKGKPRMNGARFCESHPTGVYVLNMAGHLSCCVDGVIHDTWDCSEKCVYTAYRIPPKMMPMPGTERFPEFIESINNDKSNGALDGIKIVEMFAEMIGAKIRYKYKLPWIALTEETFPVVSEHLLKDEQFKKLRWENSRGSNKTLLWDKESGMKLELRHKGLDSYLWCIDKGRS